MNITTYRGNKRLMSRDNLFFASIRWHYMGADKDEKTPIPHLKILANDGDEDNSYDLAELYFDRTRADREVVIYGNSQSHQHHYISGARLLRLATFITDLQDYIMKNPDYLTSEKCWY